MQAASSTPGTRKSTPNAPKSQGVPRIHGLARISGEARRRVRGLTPAACLGRWPFGLVRLVPGFEVASGIAIVDREHPRGPPGELHHRTHRADLGATNGGDRTLPVALHEK